MILQEELRKTLINYINCNGIKYSYIANYININRGTLCHFLKGDRRLHSANAENLINYLKDKKVNMNN